MKNRYAHKMSPLSVALLIVYCLGAGCAAIDPPRSSGPRPRTLSTLGAEQNGVHVTVAKAPREFLLQRASILLKPLGKGDFAEVLEDEYINYAQDNYSEQLTLYNRHQSQAWDMSFSEFGPAPFAGGIPLTPYLNRLHQLELDVVVVTVTNNRSEKIEVKPDYSVMTAESGTQFKPLNEQALIEYACPEYYRSNMSVPPHAWTYNPRDVALKRKIIRDTQLRDRRLYPGESVTGILSFAVSYSAESPAELLLREVIIFDGATPVAEEQFVFFYDALDNK